MKSIYIVVTCISLLALGSCKKTVDIETLIRDWVGKELSFPEDAVYTVQGDTVQYNPLENDYNIIVYVDSMGCTECKMRMSAWNAFMAALNKQETRIGLCFVIDGVDADVIAQLAKQNDFYYPMLFIPGNRYGFPEDYLYQVVLLDDSNMILAVGNPINNQSIARLYRSILKVDEERSEHEISNANVTFSTKRIPLGVIRPGEKKKTQVVITNDEDSAVVITQISTSCHCTLASVSTDSIHPGRSIILDITQTNDSTIGPFVRDIFMYFKNNPRPIQIELTGHMLN